MSNPRVIVLIGPSGAGKSSVTKVLCNTHGFTLEKTVTTRPQRDKFDTDHLFVSDDMYDTLLADGAFYGTLDVFGYRYGLLRFTPEQKTLLLLRAPAIQEFLTMFPKAFIIEIDASIETLEKRLSARGSLDRINHELITKEIMLGNTLAANAFSSDALSSKEIADCINELTA